MKDINDMLKDLLRFYFEILAKVGLVHLKLYERQGQLIEMSATMNDAAPPGQEHSITAQEIYHGVLHNDIPQQVVDLQQIIDGKLEGKDLTGEQINCLVRC